MGDTSPDRFVWKVDGVAVAASIAPSVFRSLDAALCRAAQERCEFGGILLGNVVHEEDAWLTFVEAVELFPIQRQSTINYMLSKEDRRKFERYIKTLGRGSHVPVGLWRTHARRGLYLDQRDFELFQAYFRDPSSIFLVAASGEGTAGRAGLFIWEENDVRRHTSYLEFAIPHFDDRAAAAATFSWRVWNGDLQSGAAQSLTALLEAARSLGNVRIRLRLTRTSWLGPAAKVALTVALPVASFYVGREIAWHRLRARTPAIVHPVSEDMASAPTPAPPR